MQNLTLITILTLLLSSIKVNAQTTITDTGQLRTAINETIKPNNIRNITASKMNWIMNGMVNVFGKSCNQYFGNIQGSVTDNSALAAALAGKQNTLPSNQLLDIKNYYLDGHQSLRNFADDARSSLNARYDSANYGFISFSDTSNLMLNKGVIANIDSFPLYGGFYRYSPTSTNGTRPSSGGLGVVMNIVAQDMKVSKLGEGRVYQFAMDGSLNKSFIRYYNGSWTAWDTIYTSSYHPGSGGGGGGSYYPLTGGYLQNPGFIGLPVRAGNPTTPVGDTINIYTNGSGYLACQTRFGIQTNDFSAMTTNRKITWDDLGGHPTLQGNTFNGASQLVQLDASGKLPAIDGSQLTNLPSGTPLSGTGYVKMSGSTPSYVASIPTSDIGTSFTNDITVNNINPNSDNTYNLGTSTLRFNQAYINTLAGLNLNIRTTGTGQDLKLQNNTQTGLTILGTSSYVQLNQTPATNVEATPLVLIRNATTGNVEQIASTSLPARVTAVFIGNQNTSTVAASTTTYGIVSGQAGTGILASKSIVVGQSGTLKNAYLLTGSAQDVSGSLTCTLYVNGSATSIVITVAAGAAAGTYSDTTHTATLSAGDTIAWKFTNNATSASATLGNTSLTLSN